MDKGENLCQVLCLKMHCTVKLSYDCPRQPKAGVAHAGLFILQLCYNLEFLQKETLNTLGKPQSNFKEVLKKFSIIRSFDVCKQGFVTQGVKIHQNFQRLSSLFYVSRMTFLSHQYEYREENVFWLNITHVFQGFFQRVFFKEILRDS